MRGTASLGQERSISRPGIAAQSGYSCVLCTPTSPLNFTRTFWLFPDLPKRAEGAQYLSYDRAGKAVAAVAKDRSLREAPLTDPKHAETARISRRGREGMSIL
jgi:hypothetical protein